MGKKFALSSYSVVVDTNALWCDNPSVLVSETFQSNWAKCGKLTTVVLYVPEIVRGERLHQLNKYAKEVLQKAINTGKTITAISDIPAAPLPTLDQIKKGIEKQFDDWLKSAGGMEVKTPYLKINWQGIVQDAIWRNPPFEDAPLAEKGKKKTDSEKGFRDRLIIECLREVVEAKDGSRIAVMVSNDVLLKEAIAAQFAELVAIYDSIESFYRALQTTPSFHDNQLGQRIAQKAPIEFYDPTNPKCFYTGCRIIEELRQIDDLDRYPWQAHRLYLMQLNVEQGNPPLLGYDDGDLATNPYKPKPEEKVWHNRTEFADYKDDRTYWKTLFSQVRLFENVRPDVFDLLAFMVRVSQWEVLWSCKIDNQSNFTDFKEESMMQSKDPYVEPLLDIHGMRASEAWKNAI